VHLRTFLSIPITQKLPNFELWHSCRKWAICSQGAILRTNFILTRRKIPKDSNVWFIHSLYYVLMTNRVDIGYYKFSLFIQDTTSSQTQQLYYTITFKATYFNCTELSSGLLKIRSNVSTFIVHSGIKKAYNTWYSQYKSTRVRDLITVCTGWTQKHSLISSSYKIKTYWNIFINMGLQIH
jgi:hypothetical protein